MLINAHLWLQVCEYPAQCS